MSLHDAIRYALREEADPPVSAPEASSVSGLTKRQLEIAGLVADGLTNRETAALLHISERTVEGHLEQIRNKLDVNSRVQIAAWYIQRPRS
jgi:non-specific serine/threonine protein kinase